MMRGEGFVMSDDSNERFLTVSDVARRLNVSESVVRNLLKTGGLPHFRFGDRSIRISSIRLQQWCYRSEKKGEENDEITNQE